MKKNLLACVLGSLFILPAVAAPQQSDCAYSPRQTLVRDARDATQIENLINQGVIFDEETRCGGTLMQLAVRRGNAEVFRALLQQDLKRAVQKVSLDEFPIPGAPKKIPLWLFAAYYAPNESIIDLMRQALQQLGANMAMTDDSGRDVLWYMDKNPVLRQTALYDELNGLLLTTLANGSQGGVLSSTLTLNTPQAMDGGTLNVTGAANLKAAEMPSAKSGVSPKSAPQPGQLSLTGENTANHRDILEPTK